MKKSLYQGLQHLRKHPRTAAIGFIFVAVMMVSSALIELRLSRNGIMHLMTEQAHSLIETLLITSRNTLLTNQAMDDAITERLLNDAEIVRLLYVNHELTNSRLAELAERFRVNRINIFDKSGKKLYFSHPQEHFGEPERHNPKQFLEPIFTDRVDSLIIGFKQARFEEGDRFAVAVSTPENFAIVVNIDAQEILKFRKKIGYGSLLRALEENPGIIYVALQDEQGVLAASANVQEMESISGSPFLTASIDDLTLGTRITSFNERRVFEAVHPLFFEGRPIGLFRLGISLSPMEKADARMFRRIIYISIVLAFLASVLIAIVMVLQHSETNRKLYEVVETYSANIIRHVSDAVIVLDGDDRISIFNDAAGKMFSRVKTEVIGSAFRKIMDCDDCAEMISRDGNMQDVQCKVGGRLKYLMVSRSVFLDEKDRKNTILVIRDLTGQRKMEAQVQRRERLLAMGELASGVAHEIRNPLNTIGTIVQQLDKDFEPNSNAEEYHDLAGLVYHEVHRINRTVKDFLRFSRPEKINPQKFGLAKFIGNLQKQFTPLLEINGGSLSVSGEWVRDVIWDRNQIQQIFVNLLQNAIDATHGKGKIEIFAWETDSNSLEMHICDNGPGIEEGDLSKVFNLYFTTKAKGTGIGLSIVQRIIYEHGGIISAARRSGGGTDFTILMPLQVNSEKEKANESA